MTRSDFLARCANAWDEGLCTPEQLALLTEWIDFVNRFEAGQMNHVYSFMHREVGRTGNFLQRTLAADPQGYKLVQLTALLAHPCQKCATSSSKDAWWTRSALCEHKGQS